MDPITGTIVAAIAAGAAAGVSEVGKQASSDLYKKLKDLVTSKFGQENKVSQAIKDLEQDCDSKGRQMVLAEQMELQKADKDPEILLLATRLREALQETDAGRQAIAKYMIDAKGAHQVVTFGDHAHVEGGIHSGDSKK